jgi:hypothetical protein
MNPSLRFILFVLTLFIVFAPAIAVGAIAPRTEKELAAGAALIVTGKVTEFTVTSRVSGTLEIKLEVASVIKGAGVKAGGTLRVVSSAVSLKLYHAQIAGPQGLSPLPQKGDVVTAWLNPTPGSAGAKGGITYSPILPNGIQKTVVPPKTGAEAGK